MLRMLPDVFPDLLFFVYISFAFFHSFAKIRSMIMWIISNTWDILHGTSDHRMITLIYLFYYIVNEKKNIYKNQNCATRLHQCLSLLLI